MTHATLSARRELERDVLPHLPKVAQQVYAKIVAGAFYDYHEPIKAVRTLIDAGLIGGGGRVVEMKSAAVPLDYLPFKLESWQGNEHGEMGMMPDLLMAVEFGVRAVEKGQNLQAALRSFRQMMTGENDDLPGHEEWARMGESWKGVQPAWLNDVGYDEETAMLEAKGLNRLDDGQAHLVYEAFFGPKDMLTIGDCANLRQVIDRAGAITEENGMIMVRNQITEAAALIFGAEGRNPSSPSWDRMRKAFATFAAV